MLRPQSVRKVGGWVPKGRGCGRKRVGDLSWVGAQSCWRGRSVGARSPCLIHPARSSQVCGASVTDASRSLGGPCAGGISQPVKHAADEQGSTLGAAGRCFFAFMRTYTMACLTSRGDVRARAWNRSSQTRPVRLSMRLTARATRIERPMSPRERELLSAASTSKCKWSVCTEKCTRRNQDRAVRPSARRISRNTTWRRKLGKRRDARSVTWTSCAPGEPSGEPPLESARSFVPPRVAFRLAFET